MIIEANVVFQAAQSSVGEVVTVEDTVLNI